MLLIVVHVHFISVALLLYGRYDACSLLTWCASCQTGYFPLSLCIAPVHISFTYNRVIPCHLRLIRSGASSLCGLSSVCDFHDVIARTSLRCTSSACICSCVSSCAILVSWCRTSAECNCCSAELHPQSTDTVSPRALSACSRISTHRVPEAPTQSTAPTNVLWLD